MNTRRPFILIVLALTIATELRAQQVSRRSQFMFNTFMVNPAVAGTQGYSPIFASYRNQWAGFKGAPTTMLASAHTSLPYRLGAGAILYRDDTGGAISRTGVELAGAYHVDLNNEDAVSFGLSANVSQYKFDNSKLVVYDPTDQALNGGALESNLNVDATFGFLVYGKQYYFGFAIPQLIESKLKLESNGQPGKNINIRHYQFMGSYRYYLNDYWDLQPSAYMKFTQQTPPQLDFNVRANYVNKAYFGVTYRPKDAVVIMFGITYNNFVFGYSYDITTSMARTLSPQSHEIILGYYLPRQKGKFRNNSLGPRSMDRGKYIY